MRCCISIPSQCLCAALAQTCLLGGFLTYKLPFLLKIIDENLPKVGQGPVWVLNASSFCVYVAVRA